MKLSAVIAAYSERATLPQVLPQPTDMETCHKVSQGEVLERVLLKDRFGFEPEITAQVARLKVRIYEVGISYAGRTYEEGKKIGWKIGIRACGAS